jgi:hypothetical protein
MKERRQSPLPADLTAMLREFASALTKAGMYPAGHRFAVETAERLTERLSLALETRGTITLGFTPRSLLLDGSAVEPLPAPFRQFAQRLHRRNIGTVHLVPGITADEVGEMLAALASSDAEDQVGREGLRLPHVRIEPLSYDVLAFGDVGIDEDLEEVFWSRLVEAAFGHRLADGAPVPTPGQLATAINERAAESSEGARRVYEALAAFSTALAARGDRNVGSARRRFVEVLTSLSRRATTRVMASAPSRLSRRRFMRETLEQVPPVLLLQLLESVAEADDAPISEQLRWLLTKLAGAEASQRSVPEGHFATEVMTLLEQWDGVDDDFADDSDRRLGIESSRTLSLGLHLEVTTEPVLAAAGRMAKGGHLADVLQMVDHHEGDADVARTISRHVLDEGLLTRLLSESTPDWALVERVAMHAGEAAVDPLLDAMDRAQQRALRRRLLDLLVRMGGRAEPRLLARLEGAKWHLVRNILTVLSQHEDVGDIDKVLPLLADPEPRVRLEAMKVLLRDPRTRDRVVTEALESGDPAMTAIALGAVSAPCPPQLVGAVLAVLALDDDELTLQAIRLLAESDNPLVVSPLLTMVRERRGLLRRWRLRERTPASFAALEVLCRRWSGYRPVLVVTQLAARSGDPEIRALVGGRR